MVSATVGRGAVLGAVALSLLAVPARAAAGERDTSATAALPAPDTAGLAAVLKSAVAQGPPRALAPFGVRGRAHLVTRGGGHRATRPPLSTDQSFPG
ncbi:peptidase M15, partial [Streptomyces tricolor]